MSDISNESVAAIASTLDDVDRALARLRDGRYRNCDHCGAPIDAAVLAENPLRTTCEAHPTLHG